MVNLEQIVQTSLAQALGSQYQIWELYLPTKDIKSNFENINKALGCCIVKFKASKPVQKPRQVVESSETGDAIIQTSVYRIDVLNLPKAITKKHLLKIAESDVYYQPTVDAGADLIGTNVNLELKIVGV